MCRNETRKDLEEMLEVHNIAIDEQADLILSERVFHGKEFFSGKADDKITVIKREEIIYFEALGNDVHCITINGKYKVDQKLYELDNMLFQHAFIRVSKSFIVSIMMIEEIIPWIGSKYILKMINGDEIDVTRTFYAGFKNALGL